MVRNPDFVYGIVPSRGEYGLEVQPTDMDARLIQRVQGLASSFEWTGFAKSDPIAIAIDPESPILVARFTTDQRDPDGRISLSLNVWIAENDSSISSLIDELWGEHDFSVSKRLFLTSSGRRVAGPEKAFKVTGFEYAWGAQSHQRDLFLNRSQVKRPVAVSESSSTKRSPLILKIMAILMTVLSLILAGFCIFLFQDNNRYNEEAIRYAQQLKNAQAKLKAEQDDFIRRKQIILDEINSLTSKIESLSGNSKDLKAEVSRLTRVIRTDTDKVNQVELEKLREFRQVVQENIILSQASLDRIKNAIPKEAVWVKKSIGKSEGLLPRTKNDE